MECEISLQHPLGNEKDPRANSCKVFYASVRKTHNHIIQTTTTQKR